MSGYAEKRQQLPVDLAALALRDQRAQRKREQEKKQAYNRKRLLWNLNSRRIMAPHPSTILKYGIAYDPETDTWS